MIILINLAAALVLFYLGLRIYQSSAPKLIPHPGFPGRKYALNRNLNFLIFSIATAMFFLGPLSMAKYAFWTLLLLWLTATRFKLKIDGIVGCYLLFLLWNTISLTYTQEPGQGFMMLVKYTLPLLYLWLGYNAIGNTDDWLALLKGSNKAMIVYAFLIGGFAYKVYPFIYLLLLFKSGELFISYASLADYYSALFVVPLALYVVFHKKIYLYAACWVLLSTLLEAVRTGLGGIALATSLFMLVMYRFKAIPYILGLGLLFVGSIFLIPDIREKMFLDSDSASIETIGTENLNFDNIQSNGREYIWEMNLARFYRPNPVAGAGLGMSLSYTKEHTTVKLIHSDYVQILSDTGLVGLSLFVLFCLTVIIKVVRRSCFGTRDKWIRLCGAMALGSCGGTFFSMAFDNVVSYSQQAFVIPFVFLGIFLKAIDLQKTKAIH